MREIPATKKGWQMLRTLGHIWSIVVAVLGRQRILIEGLDAAQRPWGGCCQTNFQYKFKFGFFARPLRGWVACRSGRAT